MPTLEQMTPQMRKKYEASPPAPLRRWGYHPDEPNGKIFDGEELPEGWYDRPNGWLNPAPSASAAAQSPTAGTGVRAKRNVDG